MEKETSDQNQEQSKEQEVSSANPYASALNKWQLKWKSKHWYCLLLFNFSMVLILAMERVMTAQNWDSDHHKTAIMMYIGFPVLLTLLFYYMYQTIKNHREHESVIKPGRLKYFRIGSSCSFSSGLLALVGLTTSIYVSPNAASIVVFTFIGMGCILGLISSIFTSMYGFCSAFDIFYHKNKESIIREYLKLQQSQETKVEEKEDADFKIIEGDLGDEG